MEHNCLIRQFHEKHSLVMYRKLRNSSIFYYDSSPTLFIAFLDYFYFGHFLNSY